LTLTAKSGTCEIESFWFSLLDETEEPTPVFSTPQMGGHGEPPLPAFYDMRGNKIHGTPSTPGVYIVRTGSKTQTIVVRDGATVRLHQNSGL
jgi:hypothetical protein